MKSSFATYVATIIIAIFTLVSLGYMSDADAKKRFGGGKSSGMQKESVARDPTPPAKSAPAAAPNQAAAPAAAGATAAAAAKPAGMSRFMGPLAGLAAGGLLAAMFMGGAFDGIKFFDILLIIGFAVAAFFLVRMFMRKKMAAASAGGSNDANTMQYAGVGGAANPVTPAPAEVPRAVQVPQQTNRAITPEIGSRLMTANASPEIINEVTANPRIPADFDVAPFERNSKAAFIRLQAANDAKDLDDIRDFCTPEMVGEITLQFHERGAATQKTEVVSVDARVIEVVLDSKKAIASVRYTGVIREDNEGAEGFDEVWHVIKDLSDDHATWKLAGIQQLQ
jgi:predicted lipid-binding transport protein (Tim44 family)